MATVLLDVLSKPLPRGADLPYDDGEPSESEWHLTAMTLLIQLLRHHYGEDSDRFVAGNMFVYFDPDQVKTRNFRGPDFFVVKGAKPVVQRNSWVVWEEGGLTPDYVIELASESTKAFDLSAKKAIYEQQLKTPEYVVYDPVSNELRGWRLNDKGRYQVLGLNQSGWLWSEQLGLWLGSEPLLSRPDAYPLLRFFDTNGNKLLTGEEDMARQKAMETQRADAEAQRADAAEAEIACLKAELANKSS